MWPLIQKITNVDRKLKEKSIKVIALKRTVLKTKDGFFPLNFPCKDRLYAPVK